MSGCKDVHPAPCSRSRTVPARQPRVTGHWVAAPEGDAHRRRAAEGPTAVDRPRLGPERSVHRGSCGAGFKHRARDAGELADLRSYRRRLSAARRSGPRVRRGPGVPRAPSPFRARSFQNSDAQRAARTRAAVRFLSPLPLAGEGGRSERSEDRPGEGSSKMDDNADFPLPPSLGYRLRSGTLSRKRERGSKRAAPRARHLPNQANSLSNPHFRSIVAKLSCAARLESAREGVLSR
ncbi:MAG: hypothetical protein QOF14_1341 [Hyphomicrobiales bacterium]|jgi:hypothetical protein|nr:hypothetical protein [Hyphomicrobiales bacterium]